MTKRERMPRKVTVEGSRLDAPYQLGGDPNGNRAQRRAAARNGKRPRIDSPAPASPATPEVRWSRSGQMRGLRGASPAESRLDSRRHVKDPLIRTGESAMTDEPPPTPDQIANGRALLVAVCVAVLVGLTAAFLVLFVTGVVTA